MRKMRKQPKGPWNPCNFELEVGDRVFMGKPELEGAYIYDLRESNGVYKRGVGQLIPFLIKKNKQPRLAQLGDDNIWYWVD